MRPLPKPNANLVALGYEAALRGESSDMPELTIQYADFAAWQRQALQGEALAQELGYWKQELTGAPARSGRG